MPNSKHTAKRSGIKSLRKEIHRLTLGSPIRVKPDPPSFEYNPWNSFTLTLAVNKDTVFKTANIIEVLMRTLTVTKTPVLRFLRVRCWGAGAGAPIHLSPYSIIGEGDLRDLTDFPSKMQYARVGYVWPATFQAVVFSKEKNDTIFSVDVKSNDTVIVYINLLWKIESHPLGVNMIEGFRVHHIMNSTVLDSETSSESSFVMHDEKKNVN